MSIATHGPTLRQEIISFLLGFHFFDDPNGRKALLLTAGLKPVLPTIELTGEPQKFVTLLVDGLDEFGVLPDPDGRDALIALIETAGKMVGQEGKQTAQRLITAVQEARRRTPSDPFAAEIRNYCQKAAALHEKIPLMGFKTNLRVPIRIEDIYVPLHAMIDDRLTGRSAFADAEDAARSLEDCRGGCEISIPQAFVEAEKRRKRGIVILGDPGSGKTTHLKRVLLWCLRGGLDVLHLPQAMIPVFLPLRELKDVNQNLDDFIQEQLNQPHLGTPKGFGKRLLERGNLLLLFDGLDEVSDTTHRSQVARWIESALTMYDTCRFVITCRFAGYTDDARLDADFVEMHLRPMTAEQAETFVRNWYQIVETSQTSDPEQAKLTAETKANNLVERLRQPDFRARRVFELTRNPLLLTNICLVHLSRGDLPHTRAALYEECTDVLLERWRGSARTRVTAQTGRQVLQPAALWLHLQKGRTRATAEELALVIEPVLKAIRWPHGSAREFLQTVRDESGLLTGWDQRHYGFMHLGFQEYLAARELRNRAFRNPAVLVKLADKLCESWWQEVILLLLALAAPCVYEPFMREVLKRPVFAAHPQMIELCLDDAAERSAQPFIALLEQKAGQNEDLWQRQLLALQILSRMDKQLVEDLTPTLKQHPSPAIRNWLRAQAQQAQQNVIIEPKSGCELVFIPGGKFMMGSPKNEKGRSDDEGPVHEVRVPDFYIGRYPVTNEQYGRFLAANPKMEEPEYWGDRRFNQPNQPVVGVSWEDAQKFIKWINVEMHGGRDAMHGVSTIEFRLPGEAEWEYACRAGTTTPFYVGDTISTDQANYNGNYVYGKGQKGVYREQTTPVGSFPPNAFGLYDMHGNVWEWCEDTWHGDYEGAPTDGSAWISSGGSERVLRGGSWFYSPVYMRSACRNNNAPSYRNRSIGFRVARTAVE